MQTLEIILWLVVGLIISEVIFILLTKLMKKDKYNWGDSFISRKAKSLIVGYLFLFVQYLIVFDVRDNGEYIRLLWEIGIIGFLVLFFYINKKINNKILNGKK